MNAEIDKNMEILMGKGTKNKTRELTTEEKQNISNAYTTLFVGLAGSNWARDQMTLGKAWYTALEQIRGMIEAKNKNNPAAMYLNQVYVAHRAKWSQIAMTHPEKDKKMEISPESKQKWTTICAKNIGDAMGVINFLITRYQARTTPAQAQAAMAKMDSQKILQIIKAKQNIMDGR